MLGIYSSNCSGIVNLKLLISIGNEIPKALPTIVLIRRMQHAHSRLFISNLWLQFEK